MPADYFRDLTADERTDLRRQQQALEDASSEAWLSLEHREARRALAARVAALADDGVALSDLGGAMGVSKQRAHQLARVGRLPVPS